MIDVGDFRGSLHRSGRPVETFADTEQCVDIESPAPQPRNAVSVFDHSTSRRDWPTALLLVERAAAVIKNYELKMAEVERDARTFVQRVDEEQARYVDYIASLEKRLSQSLAQSSSVEAALDATKAELWKARGHSDELEGQLAEARSETQKYRHYIAQIETMLGHL